MERQRSGKHTLVNRTQKTGVCNRIFRLKRFILGASLVAGFYSLSILCRLLKMSPLWVTKVNYFQTITHEQVG